MIRFLFIAIVIALAATAAMAQRPWTQQQKTLAEGAIGYKVAYSQTGMRSKPYQIAIEFDGVQFTPDQTEEIKRALKSSRLAPLLGCAMSYCTAEDIATPVFMKSAKVSGNTVVYQSAQLNYDQVAQAIIGFTDSGTPVQNMGVTQIQTGSNSNPMRGVLQQIRIPSPVELVPYNLRRYIPFGIGSGRSRF